MKKNVASQVVGVQMVSASDGSAFSGAVSVFVTGDGGVQGAGAGTAPAHEGNGCHTYTPTQAETNYNHIAFTFTGTGAVPATVQVYTTFPQTGDGYAEVTNGTYGLSAIETLVDDLETRIGTPSNFGSGATVAANLVDIEAQTDDIGVAGAGLTAIPWNTTWDAEVQSEVEDAIVVHRLDELLNADSDIDGAAPPTVGSVFHELMTKTAGSFTFDQTTDSLEAVRDNMGTAQTGDAYARLGAPIGASVSADIAGVQSDTNDIQTRLPAALVSGRIDASVGAMAANTMTAAAAAADLTTELQSGLATAADLATVDTVVDAIKVQTDKFVFTVANQVNANVQYVNDVQVNGTGTGGDPWGP